MLFRWYFKASALPETKVEKNKAAGISNHVIIRNFVLAQKTHSVTPIFSPHVP
jgi:hypothetical protein